MLKLYSYFYNTWFLGSWFKQLLSVAIVPSKCIILCGEIMQLVVNSPWQLVARGRSVGGGNTHLIHHLCQLFATSTSGYRVASSSPRAHCSWSRMGRIQPSSLIWPISLMHSIFVLEVKVTRIKGSRIVKGVRLYCVCLILY